nr:hypothetical protein CFP56_74951 [Quercus suber]
MLLQIQQYETWHWEPERAIGRTWLDDLQEFLQPSLLFGPLIYSPGSKRRTSFICMPWPVTRDASRSATFVTCAYVLWEFGSRNRICSSRFWLCACFTILVRFRSRCGEWILSLHLSRLTLVDLTGSAPWVQAPAPTSRVLSDVLLLCLSKSTKLTSLNIVTGHHGSTLRAFDSKVDPILTSRLEHSASDLHLYSLLQTGFAGVDQMVARGRWRIAWESARMRSVLQAVQRYLSSTSLRCFIPVVILAVSECSSVMMQ